MPRVLTAEAEEMLRTLPGWAQNAPEHQALCQVYAKETSRLRTMAREVRDGLIPTITNALMLPLWETLLKLTVNPAGKTVAERRDAVLAKLLQAPADPAGSTWEQRVSVFIGPVWTWTYAEEEPQTIHVTVPWEPGSPQFILSERILRAEIPAAYELVMGFEGGFILDASELDDEPFHPK